MGLINRFKMIRRNSKGDVRSGHQVTIRLLDDNEVLQVDIQVSLKLISQIY